MFPSFLASLEMTELDISNIPSLYRFTKHYHSTSDVSSGFGTRRAKNNFFATKLATGNVPPLMLLSFRLTGEIWDITSCIGNYWRIKVYRMPPVKKYWTKKVFRMPPVSKYYRKKVFRMPLVTKYSSKKVFRMRPV